MMHVKAKSTVIVWWIQLRYFAKPFLPFDKHRTITSLFCERFRIEGPKNIHSSSGWANNHRILLPFNLGISSFLLDQVRYVCRIRVNMTKKALTINIRMFSIMTRLALYENRGGGGVGGRNRRKE